MHSKKKKFSKKSFLPTYPNLFQAVTGTTHIFIWSNISSNSHNDFPEKTPRMNLSILA